MRWKPIVCLLMLAAPPATAQAMPAFTDGVWTTTGYGQVFSISGDQLQRYEITGISCQKSVAAVRAGASPASVRFTGSTINHDTGVTDAFVFRPGRHPDQLVLHVDGSATNIELERSPTLPPACLQPQPSDPLTNFDIFARTFAEHYPFFAQHRVDWPAATAAHRASIGPTTDRQTLFAQMRDLLAPLEDAHVAIEAPDLGLDYGGWRPPAPRAETMPLRALTIIEKHFLTTPLAWHCNRQIAFGMLPDGIGYLLITSFENYDKNADSGAQTAALDAALDEIFATAGDLKGLVIDIRLNGGGTEILGLTIAARLTARPYLASNKIFRIDPADPAKFSPPQPIMVTPSSRPGYYGPIALLLGHDSVSAAETFAMALQGREDKPTFIGENTQGVFSDVMLRHLPNGWRIGVPNEIYLNERGQNYDIAGVPPDIHVPLFTEADLVAERDPALEAAMKTLDKRTR